MAEHERRGRAVHEKSYHSIALPATEAMTIRRSCRSASGRAALGDCTVSVGYMADSEGEVGACRLCSTAGCVVGTVPRSNPQKRGGSSLPLMIAPGAAAH